ncbi:MAG: ribosome hibernation-promoting factor, HPF/YfiA family [Brevinema sp.]
MNIIMTGHQTNLSEGLKTFISEKVSAKLSHFSNRLHNISVILEKENRSYKCEFNATSDFGDFHSHAKAELKEASIDQALSKLSTEIKKKHDKIIHH